MKKYILVFMCCISLGLNAQNLEPWEDPYVKPNAPGFEDLQKGNQLQLENNIENAIVYYEKAAKKGNLFAVQSLGYLYITKLQDYSKGLQYFNLGVNKGYPPCMHALAYLYTNGIGVSKNSSVAFNLFKKSASLGYDLSKEELAVCYLHGRGTVRDTDEGVKILEQLANNNRNSMTILGHWYGRDSEVRDYPNAIKWYTKASGLGDFEATACLIKMYTEGKGSSVDYQKALNLLSTARQQLEYEERLSTSEKKPWEAILYCLEGNIYSLQNMSEKSSAIWAVLKQNYADFVDAEKNNTKNDFVFNMYRKDIEEHSNSNIGKSEIAKNDNLIVSDIDKNIPESKILENPTFAVIIANENYKDVENVPFAAHDGETFKQYCEKTMGIPQSNIKFVTDATLNNIRRELNWLSQVMEVYQGEASIIFYYAGHGIPNESNGSAYLLPVDGVGNDVSTGYSLDLLYADLSSKPAKSVVVLLDACFSGAKRDGGMLTSARGVAIKAKQNAPKGNMVVLSATQGDETAYPFKEKGHGMFTYYLLKKLQETKGDVTFGELADYVTAEVKKQSVVINGKMQTPLATPSSNATDWRNWKLR